LAINNADAQIIQVIHEPEAIGENADLHLTPD
jgi:hypothetical protein